MPTPVKPLAVADPYSAWKPVDESAESAWKPVVEASPLASPPQVKQDNPQGFLSSAASSSGLSALGHAIAHPLSTAIALPSAIKSGIQNEISDVKNARDSYLKSGMSIDTRRAIGNAIPIAGPNLLKAQSQYDAGNKAGAAGTMAGLVGGLIAPEVGELAAPVASRVLARTGEGIADSGKSASVGIINRTVGARKADFARGASPGDGYFQAGIGPSMSMASIARKSSQALSETGSKIGDAARTYEQGGGLIPFAEGARPIQSNIAETRAALTGPGGTGVTKHVDAYADTFKPMLQDASIRGGFLPTEYAAAKLNTARNTPWNDAAQVGMKDLRQKTVGGMGGAIVNQIPELGPLNSQYQNLLKLSARADDRALTGSSPLTGLLTKGVLGSVGAGAGYPHGLIGSALGAGAGLAIDSVPVRTAAASGLYYGTDAIRRATQALPLAIRVPTLFRPAAIARTGDKEPVN